VDHVLVRTSPADGGRGVEDALSPGWPSPPPAEPASVNPFDRYRHRLSSYALARARGLSDEAYLEILDRLDRAISDVDGRGFMETPFAVEAGLASDLGFGAGRLWVKDETRNVSGSHKGRHLMGIMLYLQVAERVGLMAERPPLAIASCGNAALAAAVVAKAAGWYVTVFVPPSADPAVLSRLQLLGARVETCERKPGVAGDPCYLAFRRATADGAIPFCCQGSDNGLTIEGGEPLAWEMIEQQAAGREQAVPDRSEPLVLSSWGPAPAALDAVFIQVGGGALASAVIRGFDAVRAAGAPGRLPRFFTVQTAGAYPLARAHERLVSWIGARWPPDREPPAGSRKRRAEAIARHPALVDEAMAFARRHRSSFMWPWEREPRSLAHGILDDETYDWAAVVEGMLRTGGWPIVVGDQRLDQANVLARRSTGIDVDHTGSAGLAGLMEVLDQERDGWPGERVAVIFSGARRE
jgi:threonine synthase